MSEVTHILDRVQQGQPQAAEELLPLVYDELRKLAAGRMAQEPAGQTLQATALVHEAWLRLIGPAEVKWTGRGHFFAAAAEAMRRILVERARQKARQRHGGLLERVDLEHVSVATEDSDDTVLAIHEALEKLAGESAQQAEIVKRGSARESLPQISSSTNVLGWFGTNILCQWDGTNQILVRELRSAEFIERGTVVVDSGLRPIGFAYNAARQLLAWTGGSSSKSVFLANLAASGRRIELRSDVPGLLPFLFSEDGTYLAAITQGRNSLRVWNVGTGQIVAASDGSIRDADFAVGGRVLVAAIEQGLNHEIGCYGLAHPERTPRRVPGRFWAYSPAVSPDGGLLASSSHGGVVRLFDPAKGPLVESLQGHLNAAHSVALPRMGGA